MSMIELVPCVLQDKMSLSIPLTLLCMVLPSVLVSGQQLDVGTGGDFMCAIVSGRLGTEINCWGTANG